MSRKYSLKALADLCEDLDTEKFEFKKCTNIHVQLINKEKGVIVNWWPSTKKNRAMFQIVGSDQKFPSQVMVTAEQVLKMAMEGPK